MEIIKKELFYPLRKKMIFYVAEQQTGLLFIEEWLFKFCHQSFGFLLGVIGAGYILAFSLPVTR